MAEGSEKHVDEMTAEQLRERAAELEITGHSSMSRDELLQSVKDAEEQTAFLPPAGLGRDSSAEPNAADESGYSEDDWRPPESSGPNGGGTNGSGKSGAARSSGNSSDTAASGDSNGDSSDTAASTDSNSDSSDNEEDASDITAPSIGPNTTIEHVPPEERLDLDKISDVDAMGLDKRRQVGGQRYGASPAKQAAVYGGALAVIAAAVIGAKLLADELDQPPAVQEDTAPWAEGEQKSPPPIDFPRSTEQ